MESPGGTAPPKRQTIHNNKQGKEGVNSFLSHVIITLAGVPKILQSKQRSAKAMKIWHLRNHLPGHEPPQVPPSPTGSSVSEIRSFQITVPSLT